VRQEQNQFPVPAQEVREKDVSNQSFRKLLQHQASCSKFRSNVLKENRIPAREETPNGREAGAKAEAAATQATRTLRRSMAILEVNGFSLGLLHVYFFWF
jgi:hypothetical protein